jgi:integrase
VEKVGEDPRDALIAQMKQEDVLPGAEKPVTIPKPAARPLLADEIKSFLQERATRTTAARGTHNWERELKLFAEVTGKTHLDEICRDDLFKMIKHFQAKGSDPRTVFNRLCRIGTFLNNRRHVVDFKFRQMGHSKGGDLPKVTEPEVDYYNEHDPDELKKFFAACGADERIRYLFFLRTGCREREVMFATWADIKFAAYDPHKPDDEQETSTFTIREKPAMGFRVKNGKSREVPIADDLVEALKTYRVLM